MSEISYEASIYSYWRPTCSDHKSSEMSPWTVKITEWNCGSNLFLFFLKINQEFKKVNHFLNNGIPSEDPDLM